MIRITQGTTVITIDADGIEIVDPGGGVDGQGVVALTRLPPSADAAITLDTEARTTGTGRSRYYVTVGDPPRRVIRNFRHSHGYDDASASRLRWTVGAGGFELAATPSVEVSG